MKKLLFTLPVVLFLAAGCSSSQPVVQNQLPPTSPSAQTQQTPPPVQNTLLKTYTNTQYGYQFQYPNSWTINDHGSTIDNVNKILSLTSADGDGQSFIVRVDQNKPEGFVYQTTDESTVTVDGEKNTAFIFPKGWECYGDTPKDCSTFIIPIPKGNLWYILSAEGKAGTITDTYGSILASFKFTTINTQTTTTSWKDTVYNQFKNLASWKEQNYSDWQTVDLDQSKLKQFPKGNIFEISKTFNGTGFTGSDVDQQLQQAGSDETLLENSVKKALQDNAWKLSAGPTEGGFYHDYLYVKDGHPLILQIGTRNAVVGGMYIAIKFQY